MRQFDVKSLKLCTDSTKHSDEVEEVDEDEDADVDGSTPAGALARPLSAFITIFQLHSLTNHRAILVIAVRALDCQFRIQDGRLSWVYGSVQSAGDSQAAARTAPLQHHVPQDQ